MTRSRKPGNQKAIDPQGFVAEMVPIAALKPHPKNYKIHPESQLEHIASSIRQTGFYRNVVIARDGTILAGHGVVLASQKLGLEKVPAVRLDLDPNGARALKVLALDNELGRFAESDDRALSELLRTVRDTDDLGLLGTGYDDSMLAALVMVSRPAHEIPSVDAAAEWLGMPEYHDDDGELNFLVISFTSESDRDRFVGETKLRIGKKQAKTWSARWPVEVQEDAFSLRFETPGALAPGAEPVSVRGVGNKRRK